MENSAAMGVLNCSRHFRHEFHTFRRFLAQRLDVFAQTSLFRELHAEKRQTILTFTHFINWKNVRVIQACHCLRFSPETPERSAGIRSIAKHALYRDDSLGMALLRAIDYTHAATTNLLEYLVIAEEPTFRWRVGFGQDTLVICLRHLAAIRIEPLDQKTVDTKSGTDPCRCAAVPAFRRLLCSTRKLV